LRQEAQKKEKKLLFFGKIMQVKNKKKSKKSLDKDW